MKHLPTQMRLLRYELHMSQFDLATALENQLERPISQSTISRLESGKGAWTLELIQALAAVSKRTLSDWLELSATAGTA